MAPLWVFFHLLLSKALFVYGYNAMNLLIGQLLGEFYSFFYGPFPNVMQSAVRWIRLIRATDKQAHYIAPCISKFHFILLYITGIISEIPDYKIRDRRLFPFIQNSEPQKSNPKPNTKLRI
jgi:hypothetical protein